MKILKVFAVSLIALLVIAAGIMLYAENASFTLDKEKKIIHKSLCANGRGKNWNIFNSTFSNVIGNNYSSLGKYKVGKLRPMSSSFYGKGYNLYGLDSTNSNALVRGILIHKGNVEFETFPLPCIPASRGCFAVSSSMMKHIEDIKQQSSKPILLYAYK